MIHPALQNKTPEQLLFLAKLAYLIDRAIALTNNKTTVSPSKGITDQEAAKRAVQDMLKAGQLVHTFSATALTQALQAINTNSPNYQNLYLDLVNWENSGDRKHFKGTFQEEAIEAIDAAVELRLSKMKKAFEYTSSTTTTVVQGFKTTGENAMVEKDSFWQINKKPLFLLSFFAIAVAVVGYFFLGFPLLKAVLPIVGASLTLAGFTLGGNFGGSTWESQTVSEKEKEVKAGSVEEKKLLDTTKQNREDLVKEETDNVKATVDKVIVATKELIQKERKEVVEQKNQQINSKENEIIENIKTMQSSIITPGNYQTAAGKALTALLEVGFDSIVVSFVGENDEPTVLIKWNDNCPASSALKDAYNTFVTHYLTYAVQGSLKATYIPDDKLKEFCEKLDQKNTWKQNVLAKRGAVEKTDEEKEREILITANNEMQQKQDEKEQKLIKTLGGYVSLYSFTYVNQANITLANEQIKTFFGEQSTYTTTWSIDEKDEIKCTLSKPTAINVDLKNAIEAYIAKVLSCSVEKDAEEEGGRWARGLTEDFLDEFCEAFKIQEFDNDKRVHIRNEITLTNTIMGSLSRKELTTKASVIALQNKIAALWPSDSDSKEFKEYKDFGLQSVTTAAENGQIVVKDITFVKGKKPGSVQLVEQIKAFIGAILNITGGDDKVWVAGFAGQPGLGITDMKSLHDAAAKSAPVKSAPASTSVYFAGGGWKFGGSPSKQTDVVANTTAAATTNNNVNNNNGSGEKEKLVI